MTRYTLSVYELTKPPKIRNVGGFSRVHRFLSFGVSLHTDSFGPIYYRVFAINFWRWKIELFRWRISD